MIYHLLPPASWDSSAPEYRPASLAAEGFIHCSTQAQVPVVANLFYGECPELLLLCIDVARLTSPVKYESPPEGELASQAFPHVYGPINRASVVDVRTMQRGPDGRWLFPAGQP